MQGPGVVLASVLLLVSFKYVVCVELVALSVLYTYCLGMALINGTGILGAVTSDMRQNQMYVMIALEVCFSLYASASWQVPFLLRYPMFLLALTSGIWNRVKQGDDIEFFQSFIVVLSITTATELSLYLNTKARVNLFVQIQLIKQQQRQMADLLDLVPDNVFICTKTSGDKRPKSVFANLKMNQFFGCNLL